MLKEIDICGIYLSPFVGYLALAMILFFPLRILFDRWAIQRYVWHRPLFDIAVFMIILSVNWTDILAKPMPISLPPEPYRRYLITGGTVLIAVLFVWALWWHFFRAPWTRDGRVRAEVVDIASQVSGKVVALPVIDNQQVKKGDVLFEIEQIDYQLALTQAESTVHSREFDLKVQQEDSERRQKLGAQAVSLEERETSQSTAKVAEAAYQAALAARDQAKVNLERTVIRSPVNGYVTNLTLRIGDYATAGQSKLSLVDSDSFWIIGYFEETKLSNIHEGDYAHVRLMGWSSEIAGHVESVSRAIADTNADINSQGLANVSPIFTWVRLAQRIPIRIAIDNVPKDVTIAAGQTCTIVLDKPRK